MARSVLSGLLGVTFLALAAGPAMAQQGDSGAITGYVVDQTGVPLKGVKVTAHSPTQIGGVKTAYSNDEGYFRIPQLQPGDFEIRAAAPKMTTYVAKGQKVGLSSALELNIIMDVATAVEEVKVVEKTKLVSTSTSNVKEVYDIDFVDSMPHDNRDVIFSQITNYAAGVLAGGRIRGGGSNQTLYLMDGFNMLRQYPTLKASAAYEIQTAGYGALNVMAPGGVVNLASKSGSNRFEFEVGMSAENDQMTLFRDNLDPTASSYFYILNPTIAGPIVKDKLWYSLNVEALAQKTGRAPDAEAMRKEADPELRLWYKGTAKLTWQMTSRNKVQGLVNFDDWWQYNRESGLGRDTDTQSRGRSRKYFAGAIWESLLSDSVVFRSQAGFITLVNLFRPETCYSDPINCDIGPHQVVQQFPRTVYLNNNQTDDRNDVKSWQFINRLEFFLSGRGIGEHNVQLMQNYFIEIDTEKHMVPGSEIEEINGTAKVADTTYYSNDPRVESARQGWFITSRNSWRNALSLVDAWRPTRYLTVTPGGSAIYVNSTTNLGTTIMSQWTWAPSVSVAWDATHDGRTALRASYNQYVDVDLAPVAAAALGNQVRQRCAWNPTTNAYDTGCTFSGGPSDTTIGLPCGPSGIDASGKSCRTSLQVPKTYEYTLGAQREVVEGTAIGLDLIYRQFNNQFELFETNRLWNNAGTNLDPMGSYRDGKNHQIKDVETPDSAHRRYMGATFQVTQREGKLKVTGAYTWSRLDGTVLTGVDNPLGDNPARDQFLQGPLGDDHRHEVKINLGYRFAPWLASTVRYNYNSGTPYSRFYYNPATNSWDDLRGQVGTNPGAANVNDRATYREGRLPDIQSVNAGLAFNFEPFIGQKLEADLDLLNVLALRTTTGVGTQDQRDYGVPGGRMGAMKFRVRLNYRY
jgi:hypothetical protein